VGSHLKELIEAMVAISNPTQFTGLLSFGVSAAACLFVADSSNRHRRLWAMLASLYALLFLEIIFSIRFALANLGRQFFLHGRLIEHKTFIQLSLIGFIPVLYVAVVILSKRLFRTLSPPSRIALISSLATSLLFVLEFTSLHAIDALLYRPMFGVLPIGYLWLLSGGITVACACRQHINGSKSSIANETAV
jgi:hypothetical protein